MDRYKVIKEVGDGTFGSVWRAMNRQTGEIVAIKKMKRKYYSWEECMNLREVKSLRKMNHPNIVKLKEVIRENDILYFVFEYLECNLYHLMKDRGKLFSEAEVRNWCFQVFQALAYMHQRGYFHRDLKPENLLVTRGVIKIADFGLAREVTSEPPYTEYVSTRWYRAPEVLLQASIYGSAVDMWAMGAIMSELFTLRPLFPGSNEADELYKICSVIGDPDHDTWAEGLQLANGIKYQFPQFASVHLSMLIPSASEDAISLISSLCTWDPTKRPTAAEALQHPFFQLCYYIPPSLRMRSAAQRTPPSAGVKGVLEQNSRRYSGSMSNSKTASNLSPFRMHASLNSGVQRKLELDSQQKIKVIGKNEKSVTNSSKLQPKYRPPARVNPGIFPCWEGIRLYHVVETPVTLYLGSHKEANCSRSPSTSFFPVMLSTGKNARLIDETAEKMARVTVNNSGRQQLAVKPSPPPAMKAGGWHGHPDFLGRSHQSPSARNYSRRVVG